MQCTQIKIGENSLSIYIDLRKQKLKIAASWCITTYFILHLQRKLTALNEPIEQLRKHNILLCTLANLFLIFQNISIL